MKTSIHSYILTGFILSTALTLPGCAPLVGAGAATVGIAAVKEGGIKQSVSDATIQATINDLWFRENVDIFRKLDLTVTQGRVLITGIVQNPEHRVDAVRLAWKAKGVKQVINEIQVADGGGVTGYLGDSWIVTQIRTGITLDKEVQNLNYTIDAVNGTVYLMGVAQSRDELHRVVERSRTTRGVKQVVSYVKLAGEDIPQAPTTTSPYGSYEAPTATPVISDSYSSDTSGMDTTPPPSGAPSSPAPVTSEPLY
jgi:osmotically-inducible protein OsmY